MFDGEYTHQGELCTFEVLLARFEITDAALAAHRGEVHDLAIEHDRRPHRRFYDGRKVIDGPRLHLRPGGKISASGRRRTRSSNSTI